MSGGKRIAVLLPVVLIIASGCATKDWVRQELGKTGAEIDQKIVRVEGRVGDEAGRVDKMEGMMGEQSQRVGKVEARVSQEAQRIEGMGFRMKTLETSVGEVSEVAKAARDKADTALAKADGVDGRLTRLWSNRHSPKVVETLDVQFGFDRAELGDGAETALLDVVKELQANPGLTVELTGHTDTRGPREYNNQLSQRRVDTVRRFLVRNGVQQSRIQGVGLGPVADRGVPEDKKRRVSVKLLVDQD